MRHPRSRLRPSLATSARTISLSLLQTSWRVPLLQHATHGRNCSAPDRSRPFAATDAAVGARRAHSAALLPSARYGLQGTVLRIFLPIVERCPREHGPACPPIARIVAVAFIHRFGSSLNEHVDVHCRVIDGGFSGDGSVRIEAAERPGPNAFCATVPVRLACPDFSVQDIDRRRFAPDSIRLSPGQSAVFAARPAPRERGGTRRPHPPFPVAR